MTPAAAPADLPRFTVRTTEDVIALVPLVLGFHPDDSLVLLTFGSPAGSFHARVDLPRGPGAVQEVTELLTRAVRANSPTTAMVVVCGEEHEAASAVVSVLVPALARTGTEVVEAVRVDGRCWWSAVGADPEPHPYDVSAHPFTAQRVLAGEVVRESRQAVVDSLAGGGPDALAEETVAAAGDRLGRPRTEAAWLRDWVDVRASRPRDLPFVPASEADAARVLALLGEPAMREAACADLTRRRALALVEPWSDLVRRAPERRVAGPAALLALTAWLAGDGALAWCAVDRALAVEPDLDLARRVAGLLQDAVPPSSWRPGPTGCRPPEQVERGDPPRRRRRSP